MTIYNHLLFSEFFFGQIRSETADLDNLRATLSTIRGTWQYYLPPPADWEGIRWSPPNPFSPDDVAQLRASVVEQIFAYLELTYGPCKADERAFLLYGDWDQQDCTGLCLVLPYSADIEGRDPDTGIIPKGRNYAQQLLRLLREHDLDWGVLTNGRHWRLFHRTELSPRETYLACRPGAHHRCRQHRRLYRLPPLFQPAGLCPAGWAAAPRSVQAAIRRGHRGHREPPVGPRGRRSPGSFARAWWRAAGPRARM